MFSNMCPMFNNLKSKYEVSVNLILRTVLPHTLKVCPRLSVISFVYEGNLRKDFTTLTL